MREATNISASRQSKEEIDGLFDEKKVAPMQYTCKATMSEKKNQLDVDEFLQNIGEFGKQQKFLMVLLGLMTISCAYQALYLTFVGENPSWACRVESIECNYTEVISFESKLYNDRCKMNRSAWDYSKPKSYAIESEWDLVCDRKELYYLANSAIFIGSGFGTIIMGMVSDRCGRKKVLYVSLAFSILTSLTCAVVQHVWLFIVLRMLIGFFQSGVLLTAWVIMTEIVGPTYRSYSNCIWCGFTLGLCALSLQAWLIKEWRTLQIVLSAPYVVFLLSYPFVPESIRWLRVNNKPEEAERILRHVARVNKKPFPDFGLSKMLRSPPVSFKYVFYPFSMFMSTCVQGVGWFVNGLLFYGISMATGNLSGNVYRDFVLVSMVDIPSNILVIWFCNKFGRKPTTIVSMVVAGVTCVSVAFIPKNLGYGAFRVTLGVLGKFFNNLAFSGLYIWSTELYPTCIRSQGVGIVSLMAVLGAAGAPWIAQYLLRVNEMFPFGIMGASSITSGLMCCLLNETKGIPTPEILDFLQSNTNGIEDKERYVDIICEQ